MGVNIKATALGILRFVEDYRGSRFLEKHSSLGNVFLQVFMAEIIHIALLWFLTSYILVYNIGIRNEATWSKSCEDCPIDWQSSYKSSYADRRTIDSQIPFDIILCHGTESKNFRRKTP